MKLLLDFFIIALFFISYKWYGMYVAVIVAMVGYTLQVGIHWIKYRKWDKLQLITLSLILLLGGATLIFHNETFFKWKPTVVYWLFAGGFIINHLMAKQPIIKRLLGSSVQLPEAIWSKLTISWTLFFIVLGGLNLFVAYYYSTDTWVNFKLFGFLGITLVFIVAQAIFMGKHMTEAKDPTSPKSNP